MVTDLLGAVLDASLRLLARVDGRLPRRRHVPVFYDPAYRLPIAGLEARTGVEPRRADFVARFAVARRVIAPDDLRRPRRASYAELARVHTRDYLAELVHPETLARIFAADPSEIPVDEVLRTVRLAVGGTVEAARLALRSRAPAVNLLGGFHHAGPARGGGLCAINDVAVVVAVLREEGYEGRVNVVDLDAHPPDGTAACFVGDSRGWIGSLSGSDWGRSPGVDEVHVEGASDAAYLAALDRLLARMPRAGITFVNAGGDVLAGDRLGRVGLTLAGARQRDLRVAHALDGDGSVWTPGGGYHEDAWKVLAGTTLALARRSRRSVPSGDPLAWYFTAVSRGLDPRRLGDDGSLDMSDIEESLGLGGRGRKRWLGYYSAEGIEYALDEYGVLAHLGRLGYRDFRVDIDAPSGVGQRSVLYGRARGAEHALIDLVLQRVDEAGGLLYVHWLALRHPIARFTDERPQLPGQEVPGLGVVREISELLARMASRLGLVGVGFRPAWYHIAYAGRHRARFLDPARQGRFEALVRDLDGIPLGEATRLVADGKVSTGGKPYVWEADLMVSLLSPAEAHDPLVADTREATRFTVAR